LPLPNTAKSVTQTLIVKNANYFPGSRISCRGTGFVSNSTPVAHCHPLHGADRHAGRHRQAQVVLQHRVLEGEHHGLGVVEESHRRARHGRICFQVIFNDSIISI